jgi:hypothetical protein
MLGTAPSVVQAPLNDPDWELWGCGIRNDFIEKAARWFEVHRLDSEPEAWAKEWRILIKGWNDPNVRPVLDSCELWMFWPEPDLSPRVVQYPVEEMKEKFGTYFMTSSFSWMMALAIDELTQDPEFERDKHEIGFWGVDMEYETEYEHQRSSVRHFIQLAKLAGVKVRRLATGGVTYDPVPYPWCLEDPLLLKNRLRQETLEKDRARAKKTYNSSIARIRQLELLMDELADARGKPKKYFDTRIDKHMAETGTLRKVLPVSLKDATWAEGAIEETKWLDRYLTPS